MVRRTPGTLILWLSKFTPSSHRNKILTARAGGERERNQTSKPFPSISNRLRCAEKQVLKF
jgi:hypothetical protein